MKHKLRRFLSLLVLFLAGCATCREHPQICVVGAALVAGSIAATIEINRGDHRDRPQFHPLCAPNCAVAR